MNIKVWIQILGLLGLAFGILAFQNNKHKNIVLFKLCNEFVFGIQYLMLGATTGATMNFLSCIRNYIFYKCVEKKKSTTVWIVIFSGLVITIGAFTWSGVVSLIPILSKILTTVAYGMPNAKKVRWIALPSSFGWLLYNYIYHSTGGMVNEILTIVSILVSIVRFDILKHGEDSLKVREKV